VLGVAASATLGIILDVVVFRPLYERSHFDQVLGTFALILFFNDLVVLLWGPEPRYMAIPDWLSGSVSLSGEVSYPIYRLLIMGAGLTVAAALYALITHTRTGMLIRAGASNREMLSGLGTNVRGLSMFVFALGSAMAGFAGMITGPLIAVQVGMGDVMLIVSFLVIVIGGLGSIAGAFVAAIIVGIVDTLGRFFASAMARLHRRTRARLHGKLCLDGRSPVCAPARSAGLSARVTRCCASIDTRQSSCSRCCSWQRRQSSDNHISRDLQRVC
jgi:branched-chain amino acid transport system permease protein